MKTARLIGEVGRGYPGLPDDSVVVRRVIWLGHRIMRKAKELERRDPKLALWLARQGLKAAEIAADYRGLGRSRRTSP